MVFFLVDDGSILRSRLLCPSAPPSIEWVSIPVWRPNDRARDGSFMGRSLAAFVVTVVAVVAVSLFVRDQHAVGCRVQSPFKSRAADALRVCPLSSLDPRAVVCPCHGMYEPIPVIFFIITHPSPPINFIPTSLPPA